MKLDGAVGLVAGGASGLGAAAAQALRARGATVVVLDRRPAAETDPLHVAGDVRDADAVGAAIALAEGAGPLRLCINCAGIADPGRIARRGVPYELDRFRRIVDVNLVGTFNVLRLAAAAMQRTPAAGEERGVIVNTASLAALDGQTGQAAYAASKGGVASLTLPLARELARDRIRCVTIAPGVFATPLIGTLPRDYQQQLVDATPHPARMGQASEYAALVLHVIDNPMVNGETIRLDGALRLGGP